MEEIRKNRGELKSVYALGDVVEFYATREKNINRHNMEGEVLKITWTKTEVFYDIVDDYYGEIFTMVPVTDIEEPESLVRKEPVVFNTEWAVGNLVSDGRTKGPIVKVVRTPAAELYHFADHIWGRIIEDAIGLREYKG